MPELFKISFRGLSHDQRTNSWEATCLKCGRSHHPPTTMLASQQITCPYKTCGSSEWVNYNTIMDEIEKRKNGK